VGIHNDANDELRPTGNKSRAITTNANMGINASLDEQGESHSAMSSELIRYYTVLIKILPPKDRDYLILDIVVPRHQVRQPSRRTRALTVVVGR